MCRNISEFNSRKHIGDNADDLPKTVPYIVAVFDELSDLMWKAGKEIEPLVCRMTAIARAAGVHLVIATARPDAKVITGAIKVNLRGRIAFKTVNSVDSMTVIDDKGAEDLLGGGAFNLHMSVDGRTDSGGAVFYGVGTEENVGRKDMAWAGYGLRYVGYTGFDRTMPLDA